MSTEEQPTDSSPKLFNRLKKSLSGQNLSKANKDTQDDNQEVNVQETVAEGVKSEGANALETVNGTEAPVEPETGTTTTTADIGEHAVTEDAVSGEPYGADAADAHATQETIHSANDQEPAHKKEKVTGLERLKSLTKFSKGGHRSAKPSEHTPTGTIVEAKPKVTAQENEGDASAAASANDAAAIDTGSSELDTTEAVESAAAVDPTHEASEALEVSEDDEKYNDPTSLADIIRNLVESLPRPTEPTPVPSKPRLPQLDTNGRPIPPPDAVHVDDRKLIAQLRNPAIMNGKAADGTEGEEKPTVFAVLDSFKAPTVGEPKRDEDDGDDEGEDNEGDEDDGTGEEPPHVITDDSSVMIYIPLIPTKKSKVEMAKSDIVPVGSGEAVAKESLGSDGAKLGEMTRTYRVYGTFGRGAVPPLITDDGGKVVKGKSVTLPRFSWKFWPWKKKPTSQTPVGTPSDDKKSEGDAGKKPEETKPEGDKPADDKAPAGDNNKKRPHKLRKPKPILDQRVWIPSNTHISVQALWWGYRIFLPPPVMSVLSDKTIEAAKRAALITTAITWMFSNLPLKMFPAPMQPALLMLQSLVPYLGYIGTFISWSWSAVKSYDVGYGVIMSATWVLPVALIPGTWQAYDFPTNPPATTPGTGTPTTDPSTGTPAPAPVPTPPSAGTPAPAPVPTTPSEPSTSNPSVPNAPLEPPITIGASETAGSEVPPTTMSKRLRLVKGEGSPVDHEEGDEPQGAIDPTMSTRLRMVKGKGSPTDHEEGEEQPLDPTMSTRLRMVKGEGVHINEPEAEEQLDPTMSKRLRMVKGEGSPVDGGGETLDPTMSTRLRMVKGVVKGEGIAADDLEGDEQLDPTMSTRLRMVKGNGAPTGEEAGDASDSKKGKSGGGFWKYLGGGK